MFPLSFIKVSFILLTILSLATSYKWIFPKKKQKVIPKIYVDPSQSQSQNTSLTKGTKLNPFNDIIEAIQSTNITSDILIVNGQNGQSINKITKLLAITAQINILPENDSQQCILDFTPILSHQQIHSSCIFTIEEGISFSLTNAIIISNNTIANNMTLFCSYGGKFKLNNTKILNLHSLNGLTFLQKKFGSIDIKSLIYENSNGVFRSEQLDSGVIENSIFQNVKFANELIFIELALSFRIQNCTFKGIQQQSPYSTLFRLPTNFIQFRIPGLSKIIRFYTKFFFEKNIFENIQCNLIHANRHQRFYMTNNTISNIIFKDPNELPFLVMKGSEGEQAHYTLKENIFQNLTVHHSLMYATLTTLQLSNNTLNSVQIIKADKQELKNLDTYYYEQKLGVCATVSLGQLIAEHNLFQSIGQDCLILRNSLLSLTQNQFINSEISLLGRVQNNKVWESNQIGQSLLFSQKTPGTWIKIEGTVVKGQEVSILRIENCSFIGNIGVPLKGGAIYLSSFKFTELLVNNCSFESQKAGFGGSIYTELTLGNILIINSNFQQNFALKNGGAIYFSSYTVSKLSAAYSTQFKNCSFMANMASRNGGAIYMDHTNFYFENVNITQNKAGNGGGIYMIKVGINQRLQNMIHKVERVNIHNNIATKLGPAIHTFTDFSSIFGGNKSINDLISIENNKVINKLNQQEIQENVNQLSIDRPTFLEVNFYKILTITQTIYGETNYSKMIQNKNVTELVNSFIGKQVPIDFFLELKSGSTLPTMMEINILNQNGIIMSTLHKEEEIYFQLYSNNESENQKLRLIHPQNIQILRGQILLKDGFTFTGPRNSDAIFSIRNTQNQESFLRDAGFNLDLNFKVKFVDCKLGDIYISKLDQCRPCIKGTYSISDPYESGAECLTCPPNFLCLGGPFMSVQPGFSRYNPFSTNIQKCDVQEACLGGVDDDEIFYPLGKCSENYSGNLCSQCVGFRAKFGGTGECIDCKSNLWYYAKFIFFLAIQIVTILFSIVLTLKKVDKLKIAIHAQNTSEIEQLNKASFKQVLLKITINFFLLKSIISQIGFKWPESFRFVINFSLNIFPSTKEGFSVDCFIVLITGEYSQVYFIRSILISLKPLLLILFFLGFLKLKSYLETKYRQKEHSSCNNQLNNTIDTSTNQEQQGQIKANKPSNNLMLIILSISYVTQTEIITNAFDLLKCKNFSTIQDPEHFLESNPQIKCYTKSHLLWVFFYCLPQIIIWELIFPTILYRRMKACRKNQLKRLNYIFLLSGFKESGYFWEFINLLRRDSIVFIIIFLRFLQPGGQALIILIVLLAILQFHHMKQPYESATLNEFESLSLKSSICLLIAGIYTLFEEVKQDSTANKVAVLLGLFPSFLYIIKLVYCMYQGITTSKSKKSEVGVKMEQRVTVSNSFISEFSDSSKMYMNRQHSIQIQGNSNSSDTVDLKTADKSLNQSSFCHHFTHQEYQE